MTACATRPQPGIFVALIVIFLFDLTFGQLWPIFLIIGGISSLFSRRTWTA